MAKHARASQTTTQPARKLSAWERYTRDFIAKYKLDEAQAQVALKILKDCQEQRNKYLKARQDEFAKAEKQLAAAPADQKPKLEAELKKLRQPLDDLFEQQLKPKLAKLRRRRSAKPSNRRRSPECANATAGTVTSSGTTIRAAERILRRKIRPPERPTTQSLKRTRFGVTRKCEANRPAIRILADGRAFLFSTQKNRSRKRYRS